ncbi:MAG: hypothetical protein COZ17_10385, partial [Flavobacteriaceae bacterium CG_4_10_14_3_um_filter_33_47]
MKKITLLSLLVFLLTQFSFSQDIHKRIKILNSSKSTIDKLVGLGIDLRCGAIFNNNSIQLEISADELKILESKGISYIVEIDDLTTLYAERAKSELPKAISELNISKILKGKSKSGSSSQKSISSTIIENYLQYEGGSEVDWNVPTNFNLGSMGGCLTLSEMKSELDDMHALYPNLISQKLDASSIGKTTWGNPSTSITNNGLTYTGIGTTRWNPETIYYVRITGNQALPEGTKPQILYTSMIHAREVSALMGNIYFMWYILENYNTNQAIKDLVDNNELYFIPVVNPDGLRWNQHLNASGGGMQRKNCRPNTGSTSSTTSIRGVDLNRNFNYFWGSAGTGSSGTPSSDSYRGPSAASEPETQILVDFISNRNFKTAVWQHSYSNAIPHPYGGNPTFVSGRENEMHQWHEDITRYNRYISGATIFTPANGIADDWMVGGSVDANGSIGSGKNILATTPESGHGSEGGFWPTPSNIVPIAKRMVRINLMNTYYGGKYAKFFDLTQSNITSTNSTLNFGIQRVGQTASNFTLTLTPISANIISLPSPTTQTGMSVLERRNISTTIQLDAGIQPNDKIEYKVQLKNGDNVVFYEANFVKYYSPTLLLNDNPDTNLLTNWTATGTWNASTTPYSGTRSLRNTSTTPYATNSNSTLTTTGTYDLSSSSEVLIQFYTKWDLERNFDFVEILGSVNGTTWLPLSGKYTKPEASTNNNDSHVGKTTYTFQSTNSAGQVYDGDTFNQWVMEEIAIDATNNSFLLGATNAKFRFHFASDSNNRPENYSSNYDGYYIDDFKIISVQIPCETSVPIGLNASSITASTATIS